MNRTKNIISLAIVSMMVFSIFSSITPMVGADIINPPNDRNIYISGTDLDNSPLVVGEQNMMFYVCIYNGFGGTANDDNPISHCNLAISTTVRDEDGSTATSPISNWVDREDNADATILDDDNHYFYFQFDISGNAAPRTNPEFYNLSVTLSFENETNVPKTYTAYILFEISGRAEVGDIANLRPGDVDKNVNVGVDGDNDMDGSQYMEDITLTITRPDAAFTWFGSSSSTASAFYAEPMGEWNFHNFPFTLSVAPNKNAGSYTGTYTLTYTNEDDVSCTETGEIVFNVGHLAMLSAAVATDTIAQGTTSVTLNITFTNTGTVNLFSIEVTVAAVSKAFTYAPADHWEGAGTVSYAGIELGDVAVGASVKRDLVVGVDLYIPEGLHKLMFDFTGMYYDPDAHTYQTANGWWESASPYHPVVNMGAGNIHLYPESSSIVGTYIMLTVTDQTMDVSVTLQPDGDPLPSVSGKLVDYTLRLKVDNYGNIDYMNVILQMDTGADSPFLNAVDPDALLSEEATLSGTLSAGTYAYAYIHATLRADALPGIYGIPVTITGVNQDMGESVSTTVDARITIKGIGPKLDITSVSPQSIKPGKDFTLTITVTNNGDDTARNMKLSMPSGGASSLWEINGDLAAPEAQTWPIRLNNLAPGESRTVEIPMKANSDMSSGHVYTLNFDINYIDSYDTESYTYPYTSGYTESFDIAIKATGWGGSVLGKLFYSLTILIIIISICLIIRVVIHMRNNKKEKKSTSFENDAQREPATPMTNSPSPPPPQNPPQV